MNLQNVIRDERKKRLVNMSHFIRFESINNVIVRVDELYFESTLL